MPKKRLSKSSLLWFIRSRSYVSIPDIRRRFNLDTFDEIHPIATPRGQAYVGLPSDAARALGDLVREGRVGLEIEPGLLARAAVGVYVVPQPRERYSHDRSFDEHPESDAEEEAGDESAVASVG